MKVKGNTGTVSFDGQTISIIHNRQTAKAVGNREFSIPVHSIAAVGLNFVEKLANGVFSLSVLYPDGNESGIKTSASKTNESPYNVVVTPSQKKKFEELVNEIAKAINAPYLTFPLTSELHGSPGLPTSSLSIHRTYGKAISTFGGDDAASLILYKDAISNGTHIKPLTGVTARLETGTEVESRVTATRVVAFGIFALALKKKTGGEKYITIEGPDFLWTAETQPKRIKEAMAFLHKVDDQLRQHAPHQAASLESGGTSPIAPKVSSSIAEELQKLAQLRDSGVLTEEEFSAAKTRMLGF